MVFTIYTNKYSGHILCICGSGKRQRESWKIYILSMASLRSKHNISDKGQSIALKRKYYRETEMKTGNRIDK